MAAVLPEDLWLGLKDQEVLEGCSHSMMPLSQRRSPSAAACRLWPWKSATMLRRSLRFPHESADRLKAT
jgi:hypothetical protein